MKNNLNKLQSSVRIFFYSIIPTVLIRRMFVSAHAWYPSFILFHLCSLWSQFIYSFFSFCAGYILSCLLSCGIRHIPILRNRIRILILVLFFCSLSGLWTPAPIILSLTFMVTILQSLTVKSCIPDTEAHRLANKPLHLGFSSERSLLGNIWCNFETFSTVESMGVCSLSGRSWWEYIPDEPRWHQPHLQSVWTHQGLRK